jgi:hypothetical protein
MTALLRQRRGDEMDVGTGDAQQAPNWLFEALLFRFPNGSINIFDRDLRYVLAGGEGLEAVGLTAGYLQGRTLHELFPPSYVALVEPSFRRALAGERVRFNAVLFGNDYHLSVAPFHYVDRQVAMIIVVAQDVTNEERAVPPHDSGDTFGASLDG